jgi:hypothetical protein
MNGIIYHTYTSCHKRIQLDLVYLCYTSIEKHNENKPYLLVDEHGGRKYRFVVLLKIQWEQNGGMCDVCGQPFDGLYLDGTEYTIVRSYNQGAYVNVTVEVESNLLGYFEFRLCPRYFQQFFSYIIASNVKVF